MTPYASGKRWTLYAGDCLAVLPEVGRVDAVITDPPYSSGGFTRGDRMGGIVSKYTGAYGSTEAAESKPLFSGDNRDQRAFMTWCCLWLGACLDVTAPGGPLVCFTDWRQLPTVTDAIQGGGWIWRGIVPWAKPATRPAVGRFTAQCEYAAWGTNGPATDSPIVGCLPGFYEVQPRTMRQRDHLTEKPVEIMRSMARICIPGGVILDPFAGSGSTGVGALLEGRLFIGIEREPAYLDIAARRLQNAEEAGVQVALIGGAA